MMNQKLVESLIQIIMSLSEEERQYLEKEVYKSSLVKQMEDLENKLKEFEEKYQIPSQQFYQQFQAGQLGDSNDFFEWNTYYEMLKCSQVKASEKT